MKRTFSLALLMTVVTTDAFGQAPEPLPVEETPIKLLFNDLTAEQIPEANADRQAFLLKSLLAEADRRKVEPMVEQYLKMSFAAWSRKVNVKDFDQDLLKDRYYAQVFDKEASFGQFVIGHHLLEGEVIQIIDDSNMLAGIKKFGTEKSLQTVWLTGVNTRGYIDGSELDLEFFLTTCWSFDANRSYTNALGAKRTVWCLKPHPLEFKKVNDHVDLFRFGRYWTLLSEIFEKGKREDEAKERAAAWDAGLAAAAAARAAAEEARRAARIRTWTDASGRFSVEAEFISLTAGVVKLKKMDGKLIEVKLSVLSSQDQSWLKAK